MPIIIENDFENSVKKVLLYNLGLRDSNKIYKDIFKENLSRVLLIYFNQRRRIPLPLKRKAHFSNEIYANQYYKNYKNSIDIITEYFEQGKDISPFLSTRIKDIYLPNKKKFEDKDMLLNDWGIHHLHLGKLDKNSKFVKRTTELLFCKITDTDVYFINILGHEFANIDLLRIIKNNWDEILRPYEIKGVTSLLGKNGEIIHFSNSDYLKSRKEGSLILYDVDGTFYFSPSGGYTSSCHSINDVKAADDIMKELSAIKNILEQNKNVVFQFVFKVKKIKQKNFLFTFVKSTVDFILIKDYYSKLIVKFRRNIYGFEYMEFILNNHVLKIGFISAKNVT